MSNTKAIETLTKLITNSHYLFAEEQAAIVHGINTLKEIEAGEEAYNEWANQQAAQYAAAERCTTPANMEAHGW
jgi:hypothetical protein